jgi:TonB family protein
MKTLRQTALLTVFLSFVSFQLLAQGQEALQPSSWSFAFSNDAQEQQKTPADEPPAAEAEQVPRSECWTAHEHDSDVRVFEHKSVTAGRLIHKVNPKYPKSARKAHIEGTVVLCGEIGKDGKVVNLHALSGPKELIESSITAVKDWIYKPYLLDGEPVEVETVIRIIFKLE